MKQAEMENYFSAWQIYSSGELNLQILYTFLLLWKQKEQREGKKKKRLYKFTPPNNIELPLNAEQLTK